MDRTPTIRPHRHKPSTAKARRSPARPRSNDRTPNAAAELEPELWASRLERLQAGDPAARAWIVDETAALLGEDGLPRSGSLALLPSLLASLLTALRAVPELRSERMPAGASPPNEGQGAPPDTLATRFLAALVQAIRFSRPDGSPVFSAGESVPGWKSLLREAAAWCGDPAALRMLRAAFGPAAAKKRAGGALPPPAAHHEGAALADLRTDWSGRGNRCVVSYAGPNMRAELFRDTRPLLAGVCEPQIRVDGSPLVPAGPWEEVCWVTDDEVDYLEMQREYAGEWLVERQFLVVRGEPIVFIADAVLGSRSASIDYRGAWPLARDVRIVPAAETREIVLADKRPRALVMPLALPEWRCDRRAGVLGEASTNGDVPAAPALELHQAQVGRALYAPLFLHLQGRSARGPLTWRRLTVGQEFTEVPLDRAAGFRAQIGRKQWLLYRALGPSANRTVLGHNLITQFLAARFDSQGNVHAIIEIELSARRRGKLPWPVFRNASLGIWLRSANGSPRRRHAQVAGPTR
jgi:hypothetical protein